MQNPPFTPNLKGESNEGLSDCMTMHSHVWTFMNVLDESDLSYFSGVLMAQHPHTTLQLLRDSLPKTSAAATKVTSALKDFDLTSVDASKG